MVVPTCTEYKAGLHYLNGGNPFGYLTRSVVVVNSVTYPYFEYLCLFHACFLEGMSYFVTFGPAVQKVTRCASKFACRLKEN